MRGLRKIDQICIYACEDADLVLKIYNFQKEIVKEKKIEKLFFDIEMPLLKVLINIEYNGLFVDLKVVDRLSKELKIKIDKISKNIFSYSGREFNINSPKQLAEVLFDDLGLKQIKKRSTAVEVLEILKKNHHSLNVGQDTNLNSHLLYLHK